MIFDFSKHCHCRGSVHCHCMCESCSTVCIHSSLPVRTKRGDRPVQQVCLWHGAIPDVLPVLPHVCCSSWRTAATFGEHRGGSSGVQDKGMQLMSISTLQIVYLSAFLFFFVTEDHIGFLSHINMKLSIQPSTARTSPSSHVQLPSPSFVLEAALTRNV